MGRSGKEMRCRKHPKHRQSSGVCPSCLRDKLAKLSSSANKASLAVSIAGGSLYSSGSLSYSSSSCSSYYSSSSSSMASPVHCYAAMAIGRFTKSQSMVACEAREGKGAAGKRGFWSKLFVGSGGGGSGGGRRRG